MYLQQEPRKKIPELVRDDNATKPQSSKRSDLKVL